MFVGCTGNLARLIARMFLERVTRCFRNFGQSSLLIRITCELILFRVTFCLQYSILTADLLCLVFARLPVPSRSLNFYIQILQIQTRNHPKLKKFFSNKEERLDKKNDLTDARDLSFANLAIFLIIRSKFGTYLSLTITSLNLKQIMQIQFLIISKIYTVKWSCIWIRQILHTLDEWATRWFSIYWVGK